MFNRSQNTEQNVSSDAELPSRLLKSVSLFEQTLNQVLSCASVGAGVARNMSHREQPESMGMTAH